jgi:hypothetical protein
LATHTRAGALPDNAAAFLPTRVLREVTAIPGREGDSADIA